MVNAKGKCKESLVEVAQYVFTGVSKPYENKM